MVWGCCALECSKPAKIPSLPLESEKGSGKGRGADSPTKPTEYAKEKGFGVGDSSRANTTSEQSKPFEKEQKSGEDELMPFRKKGKMSSKKKTEGGGTGNCGMRTHRKSVGCMERYLSTNSNVGENSSALGGYPSSSSPLAQTALQPVTKDSLEYNMVVIRGIDWKYGDEDGGDGQIGTVFDFDTEKQIITVFWHATQHVGQQYRCGEKCDLAIAPEQASKKKANSTPVPDGRNSQFMFSMSFQTVIIFDWDDTLFPTTYVRDDMDLAWQKPLKDQRLDAREKLDITRKLDKCAEHVITLLRIANDLGKLIIVTLARDPWVSASCNNFYAKVGKLIEKLRVPIVYAQTGVQVDYDKMAMASNDEIERYWSGIKGKAIANVVKQFYSKYQGQSWKNIISIGDSDFERLGTQAATADYVKQAGLGTGGDSASDVNGHIFKVRTKTFKLVDQPTIEELTVEVELLQKWLPLMVNLDNGFDVNLSSLEDEFVLRNVERTLQGE